MESSTFEMERLLEDAMDDAYSRYRSNSNTFFEKGETLIIDDVFEDCEEPYIVKRIGFAILETQLYLHVIVIAMTEYHVITRTFKFLSSREIFYFDEGEDMLNNFDIIPQMIDMANLIFRMRMKRKNEFLRLVINFFWKHRSIILENIRLSLPLFDVSAQNEEAVERVRDEIEIYLTE